MRVASTLLNLAMLSPINLAGQPWYESGDTGLYELVATINQCRELLLSCHTLAHAVIPTYHMFLRVKKFKCFKRLAIKKFNSEESERLFEDEDYVYERLVQ